MMYFMEIQNNNKQLSIIAKFLILPKHRTGRYILYIIIILFFCLIALDKYVASFSKNKLFSKIEDVPYRKAALVLGCNKTVHGRLNQFYKNRIDAAYELWEAGKVDAILVSGDNSSKEYDEPTQMKEDLVKKGIPEEYITSDYAGFRTLDSIIRADKIFNLNNYTIVSQPFHCSRAIYLATNKQQEVIGYCANDVNGAAGIKIRIRETLARTKAFLDILTSKSPKFLGPIEEVSYRNNQ